MDRITVTQYDRKPDLTGTLYQGDIKKRVIVPLTDYTGKIYIQDINGTKIVDGEAITIVDDSKGTWKYEWSPGSTNLAGKYYAVIKLVKDGLTVSAPSDGFFIINIIPDRSTTPSSVSVSLSVGTVVMEGTYE